MENCLGLISMDNRDNNFGSLCKHRPVYMLPFGGRYRLIDFSISNMVNHGIRTVAIYTGEKIRSTMDHLGDGKPWDLNRRFNGLFLFPPINQGNNGFSKGNISEFYSTEAFFKHAKEEYIFLMEPNFLAKVNLSQVFKHFLNTDADITLVYKKRIDPLGDFINCDKIYTDNKGNLTNMGINLGTEKEFKHFIGMGFIKKHVFLKIIKDSIEKGNASFFKEAILLNKDKYKTNTYEFTGHVETIRDLRSFYEANLNLLKKEISREIFFEGGSIFTKSKDEPSTLYTNDSNVQNSLIANGCIIEGDVENSIIFRGVKIGKNAIVKNSIIMQKAEIKEGAIVVNAILDKYAEIGKSARLAGGSAIPYVVEKYGKVTKD